MAAPFSWAVPVVDVPGRVIWVFHIAGSPLADCRLHRDAGRDPGCIAIHAPRATLALHPPQEISMRTSRWLVLPLAALLSAAAFAPAAQADGPVRIYVGLGDVLYDGGRPYYRYDHSPVYVVRDNYQRVRYYRYAPAPRYYAPVRYVAPPRYYATPVTYPPVYTDYLWDPHNERDSKHVRGHGKGKGKGHEHH